MKPQQTCTNAKQSKELIRLGLREDTADLYIIKGKACQVSSEKKKDAVPSWSLSKMVEIVSCYPTPHPEIWTDVDFFTEVYNELCRALVNGYCWDYWSDEKRKQEKDPARNCWSKYAESIKEKLPEVFQCKTPKGQELIDFFETEGGFARNRDNRLGRIYRHTAEVLKEYAELKRKPKTMLQWGRNISGGITVYLWALNDEGKGCYNYACAAGIAKWSAFWHLFKRLHSQRQVHLLRYVKKQVYEGNGLENYKKKHFKIKQKGPFLFIICQRHTLLPFIRYYDDGSALLCPNYRTKKEYEARDLIDKAAREKHFDYVIHDSK
ncbi:MAG: hypothetical protein J5732_02840 [Bacteroidaceae bacterium]|nr:hypothetical protein [Bacteroidaceae bacterium]